MEEFESKKEFTTPDLTTVNNTEQKHTDTVGSTPVYTAPVYTSPVYQTSAAPEPVKIETPAEYVYPGTPKPESISVHTEPIKYEAPAPGEYRRTGVSENVSPSYPASGSPAFFSETVRHEGKKKTAGKFKSAIAIACIASVLGGSFLGLGVGVGIPFAKDYLIPKLTDDSAETKDFSFSENQAQQVGAFNDSPIAGITSFADLVEKVNPSVVTISSVVKGSQQFFNYSVPNEMQGAGTGILFKETDSNYYVATNAHVIDGASEVSISISGSKKIPAKLVGKNVDADLAVISVSKADSNAAGVKSIVPASFGNSDEMKVGDFVLAIGNALGEGNTATNGIISAKDKEIASEDKVLKVVQTNAAINRGNSGGPLVNLNGEVIGINTAKMSEMTAEGMGYAIPSNVAKPIIEELMKQTPQPMIGIKGQNISEEVAKQYNLPQAGALVVEVMDGSPAKAAGLVPSDIITGVDDKAVFSMTQLAEVISGYKIGDTVKLKVIRDGKDFIELQFKLVEKTQVGF